MPWRRLPLLCSERDVGATLLSLDCRFRRPPAVSSRVMSTVHSFQTDDARLGPVHDKVIAGERLSADDALALYRTGDILAVGWMANHVRERMHGDKTYFNVNRHLNPDQCLRGRLPAVRFRAQEGHPGRLHHGAGRGF